MIDPLRNFSLSTLWAVPALSFLALSTASSAMAGEGELSLEQAIRRGRVEAREVAAAEARWAAGRARADLARGHGRGTVSLMEVWTRTDSPAEVFALQLNQERFSFADFVVGDPNHPDALESATTRLELKLPLYTAGELGRRAQQAALEAEALADELSVAADRSGLAAGEAWIRLAQAREQVALLERSLDTVEAHAHRAKLLVGQGMAVESDRLRAEVERARLADLLAAARSGARVAEARLSFVLGRPLQTPWRLAALGRAPDLPELDELLSGADDRADLEAARRRVAIAELEEKVARSARLPRAGLVARHDWVGDSPFGTEGDNTAVMIQARMDLWTGGRTRAAIAAAGADAERAGLELERFAAGIRLAVMAAHSEAQSARERHATALTALAAARENERILDARFRQGVTPLLDLLDATTTRREAEARELVARADGHRTALHLLVAAGWEPERVFASGKAADPVLDDPRPETLRDTSADAASETAGPRGEQP